MEYKVTFWTEAGGISRYDEETVNTLEEVKELIFNDLINEPYVNFWYGQYINVKSSGKEVEIFTHDDNCPVKMELTIDGKSFTSIGEIKDYSSNLHNESYSEDEESDDAYERVTDSLFEGGEVVSTNQNLTNLKMKFVNDDNKEFYLEYTINYDFLNDL